MWRLTLKMMPAMVVPVFMKPGILSPLAARIAFLTHQQAMPLPVSRQLTLWVTGGVEMGCAAEQLLTS